MVQELRYEGQCLGELLLALTHALLPSKLTLQRILQRNGLLHIEPRTWYELNQARRFCYGVLAEIGERTVHQAGFHMGGSALWQTCGPQLSAMLQELDARYKELVRGPRTGGMTVEFDGVRCAQMHCDVALPCALMQGVVQGKVRAIAPTSLVEHAEDGCRDKGADACTYLVNW